MTSHQNRLDETVLIKTVLMTGHGTCFFYREVCIAS